MKTGLCRGSGIWQLGNQMSIEVHLLVHPIGNRAAVVASPSYKMGHKRQNLINLTTRMPIVNSEAMSQMPERERIALEARFGRHPSYGKVNL